MPGREDGEAPPRRERKPPPKKKKLVSTKNQLRSVERLLAKASDSKMRAALEQRRAALLKAQVDAARSERERKLSKRYHKVKFFERKKIMKAQIKLRAEVEAQGWANAEQRAQLKQLDEDEEYVTNFPKTEKYVSLFSRGGDEAHAQAERARLRALIKANLAAAALLADEDEGGMDAEEAALPEDAQELEEDEFFGGAGAGGAGAGHRFLGDEGGTSEEPRWRTNELYDEGEGDGNEEHQPPPRTGRKSTGTPRGMQRSQQGAAAGKGASGRDAGQGKRRFSGDGGRDGAPVGKRPRPDASAEGQLRKSSSRADTGPSLRRDWGGGGSHKPPHAAKPMAPHKAAPLRIPASAAAPKSAQAKPRAALAEPHKPAAKQPLRSRAEGGRKRRPKK